MRSSLEFSRDLQSLFTSAVHDCDASAGMVFSNEKKIRQIFLDAATPKTAPGFGRRAESAHVSVSQFRVPSAVELSNALSIRFEKVDANHRRGFPAHRCAVFGETNYRVVKRGLYSGLSKPSIRFPAVYQELLRLGKEVICPGYEFNTIHINHNLTCPPHIDDKNIGKSILVSIGEYTGSQLAC